MKTMDANNFSKSLKEGLKFPWGNPSRQWNALWVLVPIFGWLALGGYSKKIIRELVAGNTKGLPSFGGFWKNFREGFFIVLFMIPTILAFMALNVIPFFGSILSMLAAVFLLPWLVTNFFVKGTFDSLWELKKAYRIVFSNALEYMWLFLLTVIYQVIYFALSLVIVGIPGLLFGKNYYIAGFYRKHK